MNLNTVSSQEDFLVDIIEGISVIKVNSLNASLKEAKNLKQIFDSLINANHFKFIIDFSQTRFIDSAFTSVMINAVKEVRKLKGDIIAITPKGSINNIFVQTKLNIIFKQFETLDNALISFAGIGAQSFLTHIRDISF